MRHIILFCLIFITNLCYADEYRVIRDRSDNSIVHVHAITGNGKYEYTAEQDLERFGYNTTGYSIEIENEMTPEMTAYTNDKIERENAQRKQAELEKEQKLKVLKQKLNLTDEELELLLEQVR